MDFRILGPVEVRGERGVLPLGGPKPRAVLAMLLLHPNEAVSSERLAIALFGEDAPAGSPNKVQVHVSRLRKALGGDSILETTPAGYRLRVDPGELDAQRFEDLVRRGRDALDAGRAQEAAELLREATGTRMWRGPPLSDLKDAPFAPPEIARLEEQRLAALEARVEADAAAGRHAELVSELRPLVAAHPTRERLAAQLMLALYRSGRQAEALDAYQDVRQRLAGELGIDPGPELRELQAAILNHDPSLAPERSVTELPPALASATLTPIVGRAAELAWMLERWEHAARGAATVISLTGAPGIGKTRLAAELAEDVHRRGATVLYASGAPEPHTLEHARTSRHPTLLVVDDAATAAPLEPEPAAPVLVVAVGAPAGCEELAVGPLGVQAVRAIAQRYAPDLDADDIPADWLLDASGGVPRRVHELAAQWARREAGRRVVAVAGRAATGRAELRSMQDELAGGVVQLQTAREHVEPDGDATVVCPFKGLASFDAADAPYFFGRERLVAELIARLVGAPLLGIVGPSGSGKSSVLRAGLMPALAAGVLPGSGDWQQVRMRPGSRPAHELREQTARLDPRGRIVLAVDQFEETFTACRDEDERARFIAQLVHVAQRSEGDAVILAVRADFYGRCAAYPELARLLAENQVLVGALRHVELRRVVVGPAERVGLHVEPELVDALVSDVEEEPGALPLLSTALLELWQRRDGRRLRLATYEQTGGVHGAVARLAEQAFGRLDARQQALARRVLLRLAEVEVEGGVERRRLPLADLEDERGARDVIGQLADARLLTISSGNVEFAHEALLREWPRLRDWIDDDREDLRVHRSLSLAGQEWERLGRDESALLRGARLVEAAAWADRGDPGPTEPERAFLDAGLERERREQRGHRRRVAVAFAALALGVAAVVAIALVAIDQRRDADRQRNVAVSRELAAESTTALARDPELSVRLALWALDTAPTTEAAAALRNATNGFHRHTVLAADDLDANAARLSPDGSLVLTGGTEGRVVLWDAGSGREVNRLDAGHGAVLAARFARRADRIALGFADGTVALTDGSLGDPRVVLHVQGGSVESVAVSDAGNRVVAGLDDGSVRVIAADANRPAPRLAGHEGPVHGVDVSATGSRVVSAGDDGSVRLWTIRDRSSRILREGGPPAQDVALSPDGSRVASVGDDGSVRIWELPDGGRPLRLNGGGRGLLAVAFSADGRRVAAGGRDGSTRVWSVTGGPPVVVLRGQHSRIYDVGFGATSDRLVSAGEDGSAWLWEAGESQAWTVPSVTADLDFNRDGSLLASSSQDGIVRVWDAAGGDLRAQLHAAPGYTVGKFSPTDDTLLVSEDAAARVRLWPVSAGSASVVVQRPAGDGMNAAAFDARAERIAYVDTTGRLVVRDLASRQEQRLGGTPRTIYAAEFSPDGRRVAAMPERGGVLVWRLDRPDAPERVLRGHAGHVNDMAFSRDGRLVTAGADRTVRVWNVATGAAVLMRGHEDEVVTAVFSPDGSRVVSASFDGTLRLWDARTGAQLALLRSGDGELYDVAVSSDGKIATLGDGEAVRVFRCDVCGSLEQVRALAVSRGPRQLTPEERRQYLAAVG